MFNLADIINKYESGGKINYDVVLLDLISKWKEMDERPKILMHSCCAPCSTYVLEQMMSHSDITIFFSNSNIYPREEYARRALVQQTFIEDFNERTGLNVGYIEDEYKPETFLKEAHKQGLEKEPEGGKRCKFCFEMRLDRVAQKAQELGFDFFGSALTLSPYKNSDMINAVGMDIQTIYDTQYLPSDFKKRGGYQRAMEICDDYDIYRQCYCGCVFSANQHDISLKDVKIEALEFVKAYRKDHPKK